MIPDASLRRIAALALLALCPCAASAQDGKLRIIVFGAHPDDCELDAGGTAARWAKLGHHVETVTSMGASNGVAFADGQFTAASEPRVPSEAAAF